MQKERLSMEDVLRPIRQKIQEWIIHSEDEPVEVISLWRPLRFTLARINGYPKLNKMGDMNNKITFLKELEKHDLEVFLPINKPIVQKLVKLFKVGMTRANVMILPQRTGMESLNCLRSQEPFHDYMPYFLHECFEGGRFEQCFEDDNALKDWIEEQHLEMFFEGNDIKKEKIKDLSGMGDYRKSIPLNMEVMLENYIEILEDRGRFF